MTGIVCGIGSFCWDLTINSWDIICLEIINLRICLREILLEKMLARFECVWGFDMIRQSFTGFEGSNMTKYWDRK